MGENGDITCRQQIEEKILQPGRGDVMRWFDEDISSVGQRQYSAAVQPPRHIGNDMGVCAGHEAQRDPALIQMTLELKGRQTDLGAVIIINAREDMRCAGLDRDPVGHGDARHFE